MNRAFAAKYPGRCGQCDGRIEAGASVTYEDDELVHAKCEGRDPLSPTRTELYCAGCFTYHAGGC